MLNARGKCIDQIWGQIEFVRKGRYEAAKVVWTLGERND